MMELPVRTRDSLRQLIAIIERDNARLRAIIDTAADVMDVPDGWQFDIARVAFVPPESATDTQKETPGA
jgi:hypothetical protein